MNQTSDIETRAAEMQGKPPVLKPEPSDIDPDGMEPDDLPF
jgi:hypothetical protein